ncbi:MAG TPA: FkbM family methyltransferase [Acidimicrobiales bacterium]|jgi:FkbM family methyltransferase
MPATRWQRRRLFIKVNTPWRRLLRNRTVHRHVQGVELYMPWAHLLPDFAQNRSWYGQNLVALAVGLEARAQSSSEPMTVMDIGANIGDSAAQIIASTNARVLCIEGDPYWAAYLRKNLADNPCATIEEVFLIPAEGEWAAATPIRTQGTTRFTQDAGTAGALPALSARALREKYPDFAHLRLIKSDTDGLDPVLVPAVAEAWRDVGPVLFFEFDPILARAADNDQPNALWDELIRLGYSRLAIWDNTGDKLGQLDITDAARLAAILEPRPRHLGYDFWDVAACRADDTAALEVFDELMPEPYSEKGTWR